MSAARKRYNMTDKLKPRPKPYRTTDEVIWFTYFGGTDIISFEDFVATIGDEDVALEIADKLLNRKDTFPYQEDDEPQYYTEFYVETQDRDALRAQIEFYKENEMTD